MSNATEICLSGPGLHAGVAARLELALRPESGSGDPTDDGAVTEGIRFILPGATVLPMAELGSLVRDARRSTVLRRPQAGSAGPNAAGPNEPVGADGAALLRTPEHLLAALLFFPELNLDVRCDSAEIPGLDGSALPFREALARLAPDRVLPPGWREYPCDLAWEYRWSYGEMRVRPAARFRVRFELDRPPLRQTFVLEDAATAWAEILPARTFAFHREWVQASSQGLMAGAGSDSGLLLAESEAEHASLLRENPTWRGGPFPLLNLPAWRMDSEPVKHKILDLLGDLALIGQALPALDIEIRNGGHRINHFLVDRILALESPEAGESAK